MRHHLSRMIKALSVDKDFDGVNAYLKELGESRITRAQFEAFRIPGGGPNSKLPKDLLRKEGIAAFGSKFTDTAKKLFADIETREHIYLYFFLGLSESEVLDQLSKKFPISAEAEDIKKFRHFFWDVESMSEVEVRALALKFKSTVRGLCEKFFEKGPAVVRYELGLPLGLRDSEMLQTIRDSMYIQIMDDLDDPRKVALITKKTDGLTKVMASLQDVRQYDLSEAESKPLFRPSFEEATEFASLEDLVGQGEDIVGGESESGDVSTPPSPGEE